MSNLPGDENIPVQVKARVISSLQAAQGIQLVELEAPEVAAIAHPGQFAMLKCGDGAFLRRPLSIHRVNNGRTRLSFLFAVVGKGTDWLSRAKPGDFIDVLGPMGNGFDLLPSSREILMLAGGLGLAPLVFLADEALSKGIRVNLAYGTATVGLRYCPHLLPKGIKLIDYTDDGSCGRHGLVLDCLPDFMASADQIFACGPLPMFKALSRQQSLAGKNVQVSLETRMACGVGVCYGCTIKTSSGLKQVCHDGPVFRLDEVVWEEMAGV
jgi:dihydroorotate dehydrogenase electron transfer subunit